jgi:hypothetical protein
MQLGTDFCEVFRRNTKQLYLLAFLLTANHQETQECFVGAMDDAFAERNVFKGWEESWSKRCLIEHAIGAIIFNRVAQKRGAMCGFKTRVKLGFGPCRTESLN